MIKITQHLTLNPAEIQFSFTTSQGPGGQNVNKVATAVQLRFDVQRSPSLPEDVRGRLISILGSKLTAQGELLIRASRYRTQEQNKQDALERLCHYILKAAVPPKKRKKTKPTFASKQKRLQKKKLQSTKKALRRQGGYSE
jgi:ribosome-associated protein